MVIEGGPFYDLALRDPFRALMRIWDRIFASREFDPDNRELACGMILQIAGVFAMVINEKFRRKARGDV